MGIYSDYLDTPMDFDVITQERKRTLKDISNCRVGRDILVIAADLSKNSARISIDYTDILPVLDQLSNLTGEAIDIILETSGGQAEVVEDIVKLVRAKYRKVGIVVPGWAKSAGTIFAMAGDEILMGPGSGLGPVDAQVLIGGKRFSADAFLKGLDEIKKEIQKSGRLNPAFIPILQNISPGEIQHCENAQSLSKILVTEWLQKYKFKYWESHSDGKTVTEDERHKRATEIAEEICSQSKWLTHARSIKIEDFNKMGLKVTDYSQNSRLNEAISRYYTLLRMTFEATNIYKLFETPISQIYKFQVTSGSPSPQGGRIPDTARKIDIELTCNNCKNKFIIQANFEKGMELKPGAHPYPLSDDIFICPSCGNRNNISSVRLQVEAQTRKRFV